MLRRSRGIASLVRSFMLGAALPVTLGLSALGTVACKDESQPEYWVDKLDEPAWRGRAVKRLEQFFEDALTRNNKDLKAKEVQDLVNKTIEPLNKTYIETADTLDSKTRVALIKLLAGYEDKRAEASYKKAFEDFAKSPRTNKDDQDIKWAAIAVGDMKLESQAEPMLKAFEKLRASSMLGGVSYKDYLNAMLQMSSKSWTPALIKKLEPEFTCPRPGVKVDPDAVDTCRDEQFWQTTAARVLGRVRDPAAVEPLMKVFLDPAKVDLHDTVVVALIQVGAPATQTAAQLLTGQHEKLKTFCVRRYTELNGGRVPEGKPCEHQAALIVGNVGRPEGTAAMLKAIATETDQATKALIARELPKLPSSAESKAAFRQVFETTSADTQLPNGLPALDFLTESVAYFFDPDMIGWLLERARNAPGNAADKKALQQGIIISAIKIAKQDQLDEVKRAVNAYGTDLEKGLFAQAEAVLKACGDRAPCYVTALQKPENQDRKTQFTGIKAGYMAAILGNEQTRDEIVNGLDSVENGAIRSIASQAIDHLSPKGSKSVAEKLHAIIEKNAKSPDRDKAAGDTPLKQVMYRLEARGG